MGNTAAHQNNSDPSRDQDEPDNAKVTQIFSDYVVKH